MPCGGKKKSICKHPKSAQQARFLYGTGVCKVKKTKKGKRKK